MSSFVRLERWGPVNGAIAGKRRNWYPGSRVLGFLSLFLDLFSYYIRQSTTVPWCPFFIYPTNGFFR
jgi:hypothetical protein